MTTTPPIYRSTLVFISSNTTRSHVPERPPDEPCYFRPVSPPFSPTHPASVSSRARSLVSHRKVFNRCISMTPRQCIW